MNRYGGPLDTYTHTPTIAYALAARIVTSAIEVGATHGVRAVVSVADPAMALVAYGRADQATPHSGETSRRKAATAASNRRVTGWMPHDLAVALPLGTGGTLTNVKGGVPIAFDGVHVGGLGVAGGKPEQDMEIAVETLQTIGADQVEVGA